MKVKELKTLLETLDDEALIVLSKDSEGNNFSPLADYSESIYVAETTWYGEVYMTELTPEDKERGYSEEDLYHGTDGQMAVVLWPTN